LRRDDETKLPKEYGLSVFKNYDDSECYSLIASMFNIRKVALYCIMNVGRIRANSGNGIDYDVIDDSAQHHPYHSSIKVIDTLSIMDESPEYGEPLNYEDEEVLLNLVNSVDDVVDIMPRLLASRS